MKIDSAEHKNVKIQQIDSNSNIDLKSEHLLEKNDLYDASMIPLSTSSVSLYYCRE